MTTRRVTDSFSLFGTKKVSIAEKTRAISQVRRAISTPMVRERIMLAEMFGYFEKKPLTDDPENPPAFRTVKISIDDNGIVTHTEELFNTSTGDDVDAMEHSGVGGWSWASTDGSGKPDWRYFSGFVYKRYPNISRLLGKTVSMFEAASAAAPDVLMGNPSEVTTGMGDKVAVVWAVMDVRDLIISNAPDGTINPDFPPELQPRDRTSLKSKLQVLDISRSLDITRLSDSVSAGAGAPIIGPDNVVESGNGRAMGVLRAYASGTADHYRQSVIDAAEGYGLSQSVVERFESPILVRVRAEDIDRAQFAIDANIPMGSGNKAEQGTVAMMEAAKGPNNSRALIAEATDIQEMISTVMVIVGPTVDWYEDEAYGKLVGGWMLQLKNGALTKEQYAAKAQALLGKNHVEFAKKIKRPQTFAAAIHSRIKGINIAALIRPGIIDLVVLKGEGWTVGKMWAQWEHDKQYLNEQIMRPAAEALDAVLRPFIERIEKRNSQSYNFVDGGFSWLRSIDAFTAEQFNADGWQWWDLTNKFVTHDFPDNATAKERYKAQRKRGIDALPNFHKSVDAALENIRQFWDKNAQIMNDSQLGFSDTQHLKRMFQENNFAPRLGNDGLRQYLDRLGKKFDLAIREATSSCNHLLLTAQYDLKDHHGIDEKTAANLASLIDIDPDLERKHGKFMGEGRLREWIAECFQVMGGKPRSLSKFEECKRRDNGRAFASVTDRMIRITSKESKATVWHEIGHHYEYSTQGALEAAQGFLLTKAWDKTPIQLKGYAHSGYKEDELCIRDGLFQPYAGKLYSNTNSLDNLNSSEVFSMGMEYLSGDSDGHMSLANMDGLVEYVYAFIKENPVK